MILRRLKEHRESDYYGFHMPGHKRNSELLGTELPYDIDITEMEGFDDLHHAEGLILDAEKRAARLYGADETKFLVNGSTVGILSAILGVTQQGDKVLVARNCHKSVYNALFLQALEPVYLYPEFEEETGLNGEIRTEQVEKALEEHSDLRAMILVSPTYDGVVSDVSSIATICHNVGIPLIVDEAHGAHFGFHPYFPENACRLGADLVIHSVHKTLPSLTQTALLHMNGDLVDRETVRMYLRMLQSSSPSYVLLASIDACMSRLDGDNVDIFVDYVENLQIIRGEMQELSTLKIVRTDNYDCSKIIISTKDANITGKALKKLLFERYHLQMEMAAGNYVLAMTSVGDSKEGFLRLAEALKEIDTTLQRSEAKAPRQEAQLPNSVYVCTSREAMLQKEFEQVLLKESVGRVAMEYAYLYPPGIPIVAAGERVTEEVVVYLMRQMELGLQVEGLEEENWIKVWKNE